MKKVFTYILSFILMIIITLTTLVQVISSTLLKQDYIENQLENVNYYASVYDKVEDNFGQYILQSGLDEHVIDNIVTEEQIEQDIKNIINGIYNNEEYTISTDVVKENLEKNIENYLDDNNIYLNSSEQKSINEFVSLIVDTYENSVTNSNLFKNVYTLIDRVENLVNIARIIGYISIAVFIIVILIINRNISESLKGICISLLSSGLLILIPTIIIQFKNLDKIFIFSEHLSNLIYSVIKNISNTFLIISIIYIVIGLIITFIYGYRKNNKKIL